MVWRNSLVSQDVAYLHVFPLNFILHLGTLTSEDAPVSAFSSSDLTLFKLESEDGFQVKGELREDAAGAPSQPSGAHADEEPPEEVEKKKKVLLEFASRPLSAY